MLQLQNSTPFAADMVIFPNSHGVDTLHVLIGARLKIGSKWTLAEKPAELLTEDIYWGNDPSTSSLKYVSPLHMCKNSTDVVVVGQAYVPEGNDARTLEVSVSAGHHSKRIRVFGDRVWESGVPSYPEIFQVMPIVYERAYGGMHIEDGQVIGGEPANPVGKGYLGGQIKSKFEGVLLPNIEDPQHLIQALGDEPPPAGMGFIAPNWEPRLSFAGTYDEAWQSERAPYCPDDFDARFFSMGSSGLIYDGYMQGGEPVELINMHPNGDIRFVLPVVQLAVRVDFLKQAQPILLSPNLETLLIEPNFMELQLWWKAGLACDKSIHNIKNVRVSLTRGG